MSAPVFVGVAGGTGSGKTTVARKIARGIGGGPPEVTIIHHDAYYRDYSHVSTEERARINFDHPDALESELLVEHLDALRAGDPVSVPIYDFSNHVRSAEQRHVDPCRVVIVDGILVLAEPELRERMDLRVFVDTDADLRLIRRLRRDIRERGRSLDSVLEQYQETVRPMHLEFVEPSKRHAHVIVPEGGENRVAVRMLLDTVRTTMEKRGRGGP